MVNKNNSLWRIYLVYDGAGVCVYEGADEGLARDAMDNFVSPPSRIELREGAELRSSMRPLPPLEKRLRLPDYETLVFHDDGEGALLLGHRSGHCSLDSAMKIATILATTPAVIEVRHKGDLVTKIEGKKSLKANGKRRKKKQKELFPSARQQTLFPG